MQLMYEIKKLRNELGLTITEFADALNVTSITIDILENGGVIPGYSLATAIIDFAYSKNVSEEYLQTLKRALTYNEQDNMNHDFIYSSQGNVLLFQATYDELTGLYNRAGFFKKAAEMIAEKNPGYYVLSCIDIEEFKVINDQYGTEKGDDILRKFAICLYKFHHGERGICCRVMADNFAVLYPTYLIDSPELKASHKALERLDNLIPQIRFTTGRCIIDDKQTPISAIYDHASIAMDTIKGLYDIRIATYNESMRSAILRQQQITGQMKHALESGQFEVWFQPQFNHKTGMPFGAEALVRWRHPQEGIISPGEFIPIFESNGFVYEVDKFVWEQSCMLLHKWLIKGLHPVPISVNISRYDVFKEDLIDVITGLVTKYNLPIDLLRLEITESAFSKSSDQIIHVVEKLVGLGFIVEIDDFGSGYSSLNTLKDVPAQILKMDMKFLENDNNIQRGGSIIESVVRMAHWLGMSVIAEGVETIMQADYLKSIGCELIQGYLYSKPRQLSEYEDIILGGKTESRIAKLQFVDTWNNNAFWDPNSMETLIFNSYVGGACIFEYKNEKAELLRYNDAFFKIFNFVDEHHFVNARRNFISVFDKENAEVIIDSIGNAIQTRKESTCEIKISSYDRTKLYVRATVRQIAQASDRYLFYCVVTDITPQRTAERMERESANRTATIMESITAGVAASVVRNGKVTYLFANDRYYELLGYDKSSYNSQFNGSFETIHPDDQVRVNGIIKQATLDLKPYSIEFRVIRKDKAIHWMYCDITIVTLPDINEPVHLATVNDTTPLHLAKEKEEIVAERIRAIMDNTTSGITAVIMHKDGTAEYLFVNDRYFELVGYTREQYHAKGLAGLELMHPDDLKEYKKQIIGLDTVGQSRKFEFRAKHRNGHWIWLRDDITVINLIGVDSPVQLSCFSDITMRKQSEDRLNFINELASDILATSSPDDAINNTLSRILEYVNADRCYVVELDFNRKVSNNTYEVCSNNVTSQKKNLQNIPFNETDFWYTSIIQRNTFMIENVNKLEDSKLQAMLYAQNIHSILLAPLWKDDQLLGFIGVDNPEIMSEAINNFTAPADYIALTLSRRDILRKIERDHRTIETLMNDTPGGFVRIKILDGNLAVPEYFNEGFQKLTGMNSEELMATYCNTSIMGVHPDDYERVNTYRQRLIRDGKASSIRYRIINGNGGYTWVNFNGRVIKDANGETHINIYYTDATEQIVEEEKQKALMDNLTCGIVLLEFDGEHLSVLHVNKSYWKLIEREPTDYSNADGTDFIHPEDKSMIMQEIATSIRQKREFVCDFRVINGKNKYTPFHVTSNIIPENNGKFLLYTFYIPIDKQTMSIQKMIPIAISTMMSASENISYVKDKDLHYICASHSVAEMAGLSDPHEMIGKTASDVFNKVLAAQFNIDDKSIITTGIPVVGIIEKTQFADGRIHTLKTSKYPIMDSEGTVIGVYSLSIDITSQKEIESQLELLTSSIPGGLAAYSITPAGIQTIYFNDGYFIDTGYSREEYQNMIKNEPLALVFDSDRCKVREMISNFMINKENNSQGNCTYRCIVKGGGYRWKKLKAVLSQTSEDSYILNVVQLDITDQIEAQNRQIELLDSLPNGAALYEFDGTKLSVIHINKRYWELVGRAPADYSTNSVMNVIYPDDRAVVLEEINCAIRQKRVAQVDVRILCGSSDYKPFHISANIRHEANGKNLISVSYVPISDEEISLQEMLPIALSTMMTTSDDLFFVKGSDGRYITCSKTVIDTVGLSDIGDIIGKTSSQVFGFDAVKKSVEEDKQIFKTGNPILERRIKLLANNEKPTIYSTSKYPLLDRTGKVIGIYTVARDVTAEKETEFELNTLLRVIPSGVLKYSADEKAEFAYINHNFIKGLGYTEKQFREKFNNCFNDMIWHEDFENAKKEILSQESEGKIGRFDYRVEAADGQLHWFHNEGVKVTDEIGKEWYYVTLIDISTQKKIERENIHLAETDPLTGLLNRKVFFELANELIKKSSPKTQHAFFMIDIDNFKTINDTFGHAVGDETLIEVAQKLHTIFRKDDLIGRIGGDEYVIFLNNISDKMNIEKKAKYLCLQLQKSCSPNFTITASVGISLYPLNGADSHTLYKKADTALYSAKENGRNTFQIYH